MRVLLALLLIAASPGARTEAIDLAPVEKWIARQRDVHTLQADFVQTRALRTLRSPVKAQGRLWFRAPDDFRWQIGDPPKTIVLVRGPKTTLIQPVKKIAQLDPAEAQLSGAMRFPTTADLADFERRFEILSLEKADPNYRLEVLPRDAPARRFLTKVVLEFSPATGQLFAFEAFTREGSSLRCVFRNVRVNEKIDAALFAYDLTGYRVTDAPR